MRYYGDSRTSKRYNKISSVDGVISSLDGAISSLDGTITSIANCCSARLSTRSRNVKIVRSMKKSSLCRPLPKITTNYRRRCSWNTATVLGASIPSNRTSIPSFQSIYPIMPWHLSHHALAMLASIPSCKIISSAAEDRRVSN